MGGLVKAQAAKVVALATVVATVGLISGAGVMLGGIVGVLTDRIDAVTAAMIGGLALVVVELMVAASERLEVVPAVGGTWVERAMALGASVVGALGVALLVGSGGRPSSISVLVAPPGWWPSSAWWASRPFGRCRPRRRRPEVPEPARSDLSCGREGFPSPRWLGTDTDTSRIECGPIVGCALADAQPRSTAPRQPGQGGARNASSIEGSGRTSTSAVGSRWWCSA